MGPFNNFYPLQMSSDPFYVECSQKMNSFSNEVASGKARNSVMDANLIPLHQNLFAMM